MKKLRRLALAIFITAALTSISSAQPLVTGDLSIYYDFDFIGVNVSDGSGNGNNGLVVGDVSIDDGIREGAARFAPLSITHNYIDLDGPNFPADQIPTSAFSVAAWINVTQTGDSHGIFEPRSSQGSFSAHIEIKNDNSARFTLRGNQQSEGIINRSEGFVPFDEWVHYAATYDKNANLGALYINGEQIYESSVDNAIDTADNWGMGARIGAVTDDARQFTGLMDEFYLFTRAITEEEVVQLFELLPPTPFTIRGDGETYFEDFDSMGVDGRMPRGWTGEDFNGVSRRIDSLGLVDGPLGGVANSAEGVLNVGGNPERFESTVPDTVATWNADLDGNEFFDGNDAFLDNASDRALGNGIVNPGDPAGLNFQIEISDQPLRAVVADWDLEIWGGDPEASFRGTGGGGYAASLKVGGTTYYNEARSLLPGDKFDTEFDGSPEGRDDPTLIDGNIHSIRGISSGIVEVDPADGAVGNFIEFNFNGNFGGGNDGWIQAVDNVRVRALAAGDAQGDGDVDPSDLIQLLAGGAFGKGSDPEKTWGQGDFDNDGDFDGFDILAIVQGLAGEFPKTYAHTEGNDVPQVIINPATGNITVDTDGIEIGSIVIDSAAGIFNGPNSPSWDAPGDFAADIDTQISMPISFTNPGYSGVDDLGDGIIGDLPPAFDYLGDLTIKYLDPNGDLLDGEAHIVPEPSSMLLATLGVLGFLGFLRRRRRLS